MYTSLTWSNWPMAYQNLILLKKGPARSFGWVPSHTRNKPQSTVTIWEQCDGQKFHVAPADIKNPTVYEYMDSNGNRFQTLIPIKN